MPALRLKRCPVEKPWGRDRLPATYGGPGTGNRRIGEIIFANPPGMEDGLVLKYLFTSERLSIQVHPDDNAARARGLRNGKDEGWLVIEADAASRLGVGLGKAADRDAVRAAALDGTLDRMIDWRPVAVGDSLYSPGGTIHAIGPGVAIVEVQQDCDVTYRLFDYGRDRDLQLDEALAVADLASSPVTQPPVDLGDGRIRIMSGRAFQVERIAGAARGKLLPAEGLALWLMPLAGVSRVDGDVLDVGGCWLLDDIAGVELDSRADLLVAYPGAVTKAVWQAS